MANWGNNPGNAPRPARQRTGAIIPTPASLVNPRRNNQRLPAPGGMTPIGNTRNPIDPLPPQIGPMSKNPIDPLPPTDPTGGGLIGSGMGPQYNSNGSTGPSYNAGGQGSISPNFGQDPSNNGGGPPQYGGGGYGELGPPQIPGGQNQNAWSGSGFTSGGSGSNGIQGYQDPYSGFNGGSGGLQFGFNPLQTPANPSQPPQNTMSNMMLRR